MLTNNGNNDTIIYTVDDLVQIFHMGRTKVYELMRSDGFPSMKLNNRYIISKKNLEKWLEQNTRKTYRY